jgi:hypothetical protein
MQLAPAWDARGRRPLRPGERLARLAILGVLAAGLIYGGLRLAAAVLGVFSFGIAAP